MKSWSFLSFVLATLLPEAEGELKIRPFCLLYPCDAGFLWKEQII